MSRRRGRFALLAWIAVVGLAVLALHRAGSGELATPSLSEPQAWSEWLVSRDPVVAAMALLRLVALGTVWYLLIASVAGTAFRLVRADGLVSAADRLTVPALRRLLVAAAGVTLASGMSPNWAGAQGGPVVTTTTTVSGTSPPPTLTMRLLPHGEPDPPPPTTVAAAAAAPAPAEPPAAAGTATSWTVRPGECFWSIAEDVLAQAWGRPPTDAEIVPYWRTLVDENRARLSDPSNADLIFPGQIFSVPGPRLPP